jgi:hypothetical protein
MSPIHRRPFLLGTSSLVAVLSLPGCFGSFGAFNALVKFNKGISDSKWLQWLLFLGLIILPVYELFVLGDILIFNTIEFYSGKNPISSSTHDLGNGKALALSRDAANPNRVRVEITTRLGGGAVERRVFFIEKGPTGFSVMDARGELLARATSERGLVDLLGAGGELLAAVDDDAATSMAAAIAGGASPTALLSEHVRSTGRASAIAAASVLNRTTF